MFTQCIWIAIFFQVEKQSSKNPLAAKKDSKQLEQKVAELEKKLAEASSEFSMIQLTVLCMLFTVAYEGHPIPFFRRRFLYEALGAAGREGHLAEGTHHAQTGKGCSSASLCKY